MADRIAVMHLGVLQQYATPDEIYNRPVNTFVAGFIGSPAMNLLRGTVTTYDGRAAIAGEGDWLLPLDPLPANRALSSSGQVIVGVRHGHMRLSLTPQPDWMEGRVYTVEPTGDLTFVHLKLGDHLLVASDHADFRAAPDAPIWVTFDQEHLHLFDAETELSLADGGMPARVSGQREAAAV
jgi:multiple sugar transport system ATP-binding protein